MTWDPAGVTSGTMDGSGVWSTAGTNSYWYNGSTAGNAWSNTTADSAYFGNALTTTNYTVTLSGTVNAAALYIGIGAAGSASINFQNGTINGPAGGTLTLASGIFWNSVNMSSIVFTGASTIQFTNPTSLSAGGMKFTNASSFSNASLNLGTGSDTGEIEVDTASVFGTTSNITVNPFWEMAVLSNGGTSSAAITLNGQGTRGTGALYLYSSNANASVWAGTITLAADATIFCGSSPIAADSVTGMITGSKSLYLGVAGTNGGRLIITNTNNNYTGATIIVNGPNTATSSVGTGDAVQLGANNVLPVGTTLVLGEQVTVSPYAGVTALLAGGSSSYSSNNGALDLNGKNQTVAGLAVGSGQSGSNQYILNTLASSTSTLTVSGTTSPSAGFNGNIIDNYATGGKVAVVLNGTGNPAALTLTGANTYSAGTVVNSGTLTGSTQSFGFGNLTINPTGVAGTLALDAATVSSTSSIASNAAVTVNTNTATAVGTLNFNDATPAIGSLAGNGSVVLNKSTGTTLTVGGDNTNTTFTGVISQGAGIGAVTKVGTGTLILNGSNTYQGATTVNAGTLQTTATGTPFSTGAINLNGGILSLAPSGSGSAVTLTGASLAAGTQLTYGGGATLALNKGSQTSLTFTAGNASPSGAVLARSGNGTLVIAPASGIANLGTTEIFKVTGSAPSITSGMVTASIVGQNNDANKSGDFLTYSGGSGFTLATYGDTNFGAPSASLTESVTAPQTLGASGTVYALKTTAAINVGTNTLTIGSGGVILNGGGISNGTLAFGAAEGLVYTSAANSSISAPITGSAGLTAFGPGTLTLGGNNSSLTGGLSLNQGIVSVSADNNLGAASNAIKFNGGTLQFGAAFNPAATHAITVNAGGGTIDTNGNAITESGTISGTGALAVASTAAGGKLILTASNSSFTGSTIINSGTLQLGDGSTFNGTVAGGITNNSSLIFANPNTQAFAGVITGSGALTKSGAGLLTLSGSNTYTGTTFINSGTLSAGNLFALGIGGAITFGGGTLQYNAGTLGDFASSRFANSTSSIILDTNGLAETLLYGIGSSNTGGLTKKGTGTLGLSASNSYTGGTTINGGAIQINVVSAINAGNGPLVINSGTLVMNNLSPTVGALSGSSGGVITDANSTTLTINSSSNGNYAGIIQNTASKSVAVTKQGTGIQTFTGANTYIGATTVSAGELALGNGGSLAATAVTVASTGTFGIAQNANSTTTNIGSSLSLSAGGAFTMADGFTSTLNVAGAGTLAPASGSTTNLTFDIGGATGTASDQLVIAGAGTVGAGKAAISINAVGGQPLSGTYTVITAASGLTASNFTLSTSRIVSGNTAYLISLTGSGTAENVVIGASGAASLYWSGTLGSIWNTVASGSSNWNVDAASGTNGGVAPSSFTDVYFSTTNPVAQNLTNTLGADTTVNSLTFTSNAGAVTIGAGNTLTINNLTGGTNGITVASGAGAETINAAVTMGSAQSWTNSSASTLTVGGAINNGGFLLTVNGTGNTTLGGNISGAGGLTDNNTGTLTLSGSNSYLGGTKINGGLLALSNSSALGASGNISFGGGTLQYSPSNTTDYSSRIASSGSAILIDTNGQSVIWGSTLASTNTGGLIMIGTGGGTLKLGAANSYTGGATINSGTLQLGNNSALGTSAELLTMNGGTLDVNGFSPAVTTVTGSAGLIMNSGSSSNFSLNATSGTSTFGGSFLTSGTHYLYLYVYGGNSTLNLTGSSTVTQFNVQFSPNTTVNLTGTLIGGFMTIGRDNGPDVLNINGGFLQVTTAVPLGSGEFKLGWAGTGAATLNLTSGTMAAVLIDRDNGSGAAYFNLNGGVLMTQRIQSNSGSTQPFTLTLNGGKIVVSAADTLFNNGGGTTEMKVQIGSGGAFIDTAGFNTSSQRPISDGTNGPGSLTKLGLGTLTLSNTGSWSGGTQINGGTLNVNNPNALSATGTISFGGGALQYSSSNQVDYSSQIVSSGSAISIDTNSQNVTFASALVGSNSAGLTKLGAGTLILSATEAYTGATTITAGTLQVGNGVTDASINSSNSIVDNGALTFNIVGNQTFGTSISGTGTLTKAGSGTQMLSGSNSYSGGTNLNGGLLALSNSSALGSSGNITFGGGILQYSSSNTNDYSARIGSSASAIAIDTNGQNVTFASALPGTNSGGLTKNGGGTLTLSATNNNLTGTATVNGGALKLNSATPWQYNYGGTVAMVINNGTFDINNNNNVWVTSLTGSAGAVVTNSAPSGSANFLISGAPGSSGTFAGSINNGATAKLTVDYRGNQATWNLTGTSNADQFNFGNVVTANASTVNILTGASITTTFFCVGRDGAANAVVNGGYLSANNLRIGYGALVDSIGTGSFILTSGTVIAPLVDSATVQVAPTSNTFQLNGGVLQTSQIVLDSGSTTVPFTFTMNGGSILVSASGTLFKNGGSSNGQELAVQIGAGGGFINTSGFNTISQRPITDGTSGPGALTKSGLGTLTLTASSSYSGGTTVTAGTLALTGSGTIGSGTATLTGGALDLGTNNITNVLSLQGGTLQNGTVTQGSGNFDIRSGTEASTGILAGAAGLLKTTTSTAILGGNNTYTGNTAINGGILALTGASPLSTGTITFGGGTLQYLSSNTDYSSQIAGNSNAISIDTTSQAVGFSTPLASSNTGGLTVMSSSSNGYLQLLSSPLYSGTTTIASGGTIKLGDGGSSYDDASLNNSSSIVDNGSLVFLTTGTQTNTVAISGTGTVGMSGPGLQILSGTNPYSGGTKLGGGTLNFDNVNALGGGTVTFTANSTLQAGLAGTFADNMAINPGVTGTFDTQGFADTLSGIISGSGVLAKIGSGTLTLSNSNSYTGGTQINAGILALGNSGALSGSGAISFGGGTLQYTSGITTDYSGRIASSGSAVMIDTNGQNVTFASAVGSSNTGGLTKNGDGTLLLSVANSYTGVTTINGGTLQLGNANGIGGSSASLMINGGTLDLNGYSPTVGTVNGNGGVIINTGTAYQDIYIGKSGTVSTFGGSIQTGTTSNQISLDGVTNGTLNLTGVSSVNDVRMQFISGFTLNLSGTLTASDVQVGRDSGPDTLNVNGGFLQLLTSIPVKNGPGVGILRIGWAGSGGGSVNVTSGTISAPYVNRDSGTTPSYLNLNSGGVLITQQIQSNSDATQSFTVTLNGGKIVVSAADTLFRNGGGTNEMTVRIASGGAIIDTNNFNTSSQRPISDGTDGPGALTKLGLGTLTLAANNTYTGATNVNGGTLVVSGSLSATSAVTVASGATLAGGNNTVSTVGAVTTYGTLAPGNTGGSGLTSVGILNVNGNLTLGATGTTAHLAMEIGSTTAGTGYDQVKLNGSTLTLTSVNLDGSLINGYTPTKATFTSGALNLNGDKFFLVIGAGNTLSGVHFANAVVGGDGVYSGYQDTVSFNGNEFAIYYNAAYNNGVGSTLTGGNDIALMAIPEPGAWAMLVGGFGILLFSQRARRRSES